MKAVDDYQPFPKPLVPPSIFEEHQSFDNFEPDHDAVSLLKQTRRYSFTLSRLSHEHFDFLTSNTLPPLVESYLTTVANRKIRTFGTASLAEPHPQYFDTGKELLRQLAYSIQQLNRENNLDQKALQASYLLTYLDYERTQVPDWTRTFLLHLSRCAFPNLFRQEGGLTKEETFLSELYFSCFKLSALQAVHFPEAFGTYNGTFTGEYAITLLKGLHRPLLNKALELFNARAKQWNHYPIQKLSQGIPEVWKELSG